MAKGYDPRRSSAAVGKESKRGFLPLLLGPLGTDVSGLRMLDYQAALDADQRLSSLVIGVSGGWKVTRIAAAASETPTI